MPTEASGPRGGRGTAMAAGSGGGRGGARPGGAGRQPLRRGEELRGRLRARPQRHLPGGAGRAEPQEVRARVGWHRGYGGQTRPSRRRTLMSLPVVLPGSCCPVLGPAAGSPAAGTGTQPPGSLPGAAAEPSLSPLRSRHVGSPRQRPAARFSPSRRAPGAGLLPSRPLLSLGLLQLVLGCCMVALSFGALSLSGAPEVKNACPFWAGSSVRARHRAAGRDSRAVRARS